MVKQKVKQAQAIKLTCKVKYAGLIFNRFWVTELVVPGWCMARDVREVWWSFVGVPLAALPATPCCSLMRTPAKKRKYRRQSQGGARPWDPSQPPH